MVDDSVPRVNWPECSGEYKVVQFYIEGQPYMRFGKIKNEKNYDIHEFILKRFAEEIGVEYIEIKSKHGPLAALPQDGRHDMAGAGKCTLNLETKVAAFWGDSIDYRRGIDYKHLRKVRELYPEWKIN